MKTRFSEVKYIDRNDIVVRPLIFQNRNGDFSQASVEKIVREGFDVSQEPIVVWFDEEIGKYVVLSGHSRFEASRILFESGKQPELAQMPVKEFLGDFDEAVYFANVESNRQGEAETLLGDLRAFQRAQAEGCVSKDCLQGLFKSTARIKKLQELSHLNPKGRFLEELDKDSTGIYPNLELYARWTGILREIYPQISDSHENEIFSWLYAGKEGGTNFLPTKDGFFRLVENKVGNFAFNASEPLNLKSTVRKTVYELNANQQIADINKDIKALETRNLQLNNLMQKGLEKQKGGGELPKNYENWENEFLANNRAINKKKLQIATIQDNVKTLNVRDLDLFAQSSAPEPKKDEPKAEEPILPTRNINQLEPYELTFDEFVERYKKYKGKNFKIGKTDVAYLSKTDKYKMQYPTPMGMQTYTGELYEVMRKAYDNVIERAQKQDKLPPKFEVIGETKEGYKVISEPYVTFDEAVAPAGNQYLYDLISQGDKLVAAGLNQDELKQIYDSFDGSIKVSKIPVSEWEEKNLEALLGLPTKEKYVTERVRKYLAETLEDKVYLHQGKGTVFFYVKPTGEKASEKYDARHTGKHTNRGYLDFSNLEYANNQEKESAIAEIVSGLIWFIKETIRLKQGEANVNISQLEQDITSAIQDILDATDNLYQNDLSLPEPANAQTKEAKFIAKIQANIADCEAGKGKPFDKTKRGKIGEELGITLQKEVKELTELAIVMYARGIATREGLSLSEKYEKIVSIYECQPVISEQDSTSKSAQQYSTPVPIAFLAGEFTKTPQTQSVFEPSAGNGLLTVAYPTDMVNVNELDKERLSSLEMQDFARVTNYNAAEPFPSSWAKTFDAVLTNPPFGSTNKVKAGNYELTGLEHIMAHYALQTMKDEGRCAIIIGGHAKYDEKGRPTQGKERSFTYYLYTYYHVLDVINIDGAKLYRRQGTSFDIRLILINGRKKEPKLVLPPVQDTVIESFENLYNRVLPYLYEQDNDLLQSRMDADLLASHDLGNRDTLESADTNSGRTPDVLGGGEADAFDTTGEGQESGLGDLAERELGHHSQQQDDQSPNSNRDNELGYGATSHRTDASSEDVRGGGQEGRLQGHRNTHTETSGGDVSQNDFGANDDEHEAKLRLLSDNVMEEQNEKDAGLKPYKPFSKNPAGEKVLIPASMEKEAYHAMNALRKQVGDIDTYVAKKLGYSLKELYDYLSNYQIDSVALAIANIERGEALIIGDQTGVGKGRQAAAIIRYAREQGVAPIFLTQTVDLFSDMFRDLKDIGCDYTPFILNADEKIVDKEGDGKVLFRAMGNKERTQFITQDDKAVEERGTRARTDMVGEGYDFIIATYSQFNNSKLADKINFLYKQAHGNVLILDESHNAGGEGTTTKVIQQAVARAKGCTFLSATFAKRPDNMPVYALKTVLSEANLTKEGLIQAVTKGGVAMQEVIASQLVKAGQMIRRERSFEGAVVNYVTLGADDDRVARQHADMADRVTEIARDIIAFQRDYIAPIVEQLDEKAAEEGKEVESRKSTSQAGVDNTPYFSRIFNLINQMLFGIKAKEVAKLAIRLVGEGKSVVIAFNSTMEAMLKDLGLNEGEIVANPDFATVLQKGLESVMKITKIDASGLRTYERILVSELDTMGQIVYEEIQAKIQQASTGISLSPIDIFVSELQKAGLRVGEMTGRKDMLRFTSNRAGIMEKRRDRNKNEITRKFNAGDLDVVLLNRSAATGISLHASKKFANQKRRAMIIAQPQLDINNEVQMRGRVHRVGQVIAPEYWYVSSVIPAEKRLMMMLQKKLKSLDANTTSNQKNSAKKVLDTDDFLNKYGDIVVWQYLVDNPELNMLLGDPINAFSIENAKSVPEGSAQKVTGRVAILATKEQDKFYKDVIQAYNDYVALLIQQDEYDLEVQVLPLNAETRKKRVAVVGNGGRSAFGQDTILEENEVDVLRKPFTLTELKDKIEDALEGSTAQKLKERLLEAHEDYVEERTNLIKKEARQKATKSLEIAIAKEEKKLGTTLEEGEVLDALKENSRIELEALLEERVSKFQSDQKYIHDLIKIFTIGEAVNVPTDLTGESGLTKLSTGIFLGFSLNDDAKNPFMRSKVKLKFAVNDGRKYLAIPLTNTREISAISSRSMMLSDDDTETYLKNWEKSKASGAREVRYIVTSNVLQGFDKFRGRFVDFTRKDGTNEKGILMPEAFKDEETDKNGKPTGAGKLVKVPIGKALSIIKGLGNGQSLQTADGVVGIQRVKEGFTLIVPQSKQKGGEYYMDSDLLALVKGNVFTKYANEMRAIVGEDDIDFVVGILQKKFSQSVEISADKLGDIPQNDLKADIDTVIDLPADFVDEADRFEMLPPEPEKEEKETASPTPKTQTSAPQSTKAQDITFIEGEISGLKIAQKTLTKAKNQEGLAFVEAELQGLQLALKMLKKTSKN